MREQNYEAAQIKNKKQKKNSQNKSSIYPLFCDAAMNRNEKKWEEMNEKN